MQTETRAKPAFSEVGVASDAYGARAAIGVPLDRSMQTETPGKARVSSSPRRKRRLGSSGLRAPSATGSGPSGHLPGALVAEIRLLRAAAGIGKRQAQ